MKKKKEINIEQLTKDYSISQGIHAVDCDKHFQAGCETVLKLTKDRLFTRAEMITCFNSARKTYGFKNGKPTDVHHSAETYVSEAEKIK